MEDQKVVSLASFRDRKPDVRLIEWPMSIVQSELFHHLQWRRDNMSWLEARIIIGLLSPNNHLTFARVLNVPDGSIWPGDAAVFYPERFARRLFCDWFYQDKSFLAEHFRRETQRLCSAKPHGLSEYFEFDFLRCLGEGSFPSHAVTQRGLEVDTLNSELLLTQEYMSPDEVLFGRKKPSDG